MTLEDMEDLVIMYNARLKGVEVYSILFDEPDALPPSLTFKDGVFGALSRLENIIMRHSVLDTEMTVAVLEANNLSVEQKAMMILGERV